MAEKGGEGCKREHPPLKKEDGGEGWAGERAGKRGRWGGELLGLPFGAVGVAVGP